MSFRGIRAYAVQKNDWVFRNGPAELQIIPYLRDWRPHGIIANLFLPEVARQVVKLHKPVVDTACTLEGLKMPTVDVDHVAVGRLAADYFLQPGFTHFGFFGSETARYSGMRKKAFANGWRRSAADVSSCYGEYVHNLPATTSWKLIEQKVRHWLRQLPKPAAIFVCNDIPARNLADMCNQLHLHVPGQIAILGVDDDELECLLASPPLSSIAIPAARIGYEAAQLLDAMMSGQGVSREPLLLPPVRVVVRESTDTLAVDDPAVAAALSFIRQRARENITVATMVAQIGVVRWELERNFRAVLGCSIRDELRRVRVELAKGLLTDTQLPMRAIARQSGFYNSQRLAIVFRQAAGMSPSAYRRCLRVDNDRARGALDNLA